MKRILAVVFIISALSACAHKDLKAPCANIASLASGSVPCDQRVPVNSNVLPSTFAQ